MHPLSLSMPNLELPRFNDSRSVNLKDWAFFYEWGYARFGDPRYLEVLNAVERGHASSRRNEHQRYALFYGVETLPEISNPHIRKSENFPASGYAILTQGHDSTATWIAMKYDPWVGGHSHADKLSYLICHHNKIIAAEPGITEYGSKLHRGWYRTSLAHNTLVMNENNQQKAAGKSIAFGSNDTLSYVVTDAGAIYGDTVQFRRTMALLGKNLVLLVDHIACQEPVLLDWAYHQAGNWVERPAGKSWEVPQKAGYQYVEDARWTSLKKHVSFSTAIPGVGKVKTTLYASGKDTLVTANGLGYDFATVPMVMIREKTKAMTVVECIAINTDDYQIQSHAVKDKDGKLLSLEEAQIVDIKKDGMTKFRMLVNPFEKAVRIGDKKKVSSEACMLL